MAEKKPDRLINEINIDHYRPDEEAINSALWGKPTPPGPEDVKKARRELEETIDRLRGHIR